MDEFNMAIQMNVSSDGGGGDQSPLTTKRDREISDARNDGRVDDNDDNDDEEISATSMSSLVAPPAIKRERSQRQRPRIKPEPISPPSDNEADDSSASDVIPCSMPPNLQLDTAQKRSPLTAANRSRDKPTTDRSVRVRTDWQRAHSPTTKVADTSVGRKVLTLSSSTSSSRPPILRQQVLNFSAVDTSAKTNKKPKVDADVSCDNNEIPLSNLSE